MDDSIARLREVVQRLLERRILVVEDDPDDAYHAMNVIEKCKDIGLIGERVPTAAMAVEKLKNFRYTLCLLDLKLPDSGSPLELCKQIKEANPDVPIGVLTGTLRNHTSELESIIREYVAAVLLKPITTEQLRGVFKP